MSEHEIIESDIVDHGIRYAFLWAHDDELGRIGYRGQLTEEHPRAWHCAEFRRQLADPERRKELRKEKQASEARIERARQVFRRQLERYETLTNGRTV